MPFLAKHYPKSVSSLTIYLAHHKFRLFPKLNTALKGSKIITVDEIKENVIKQLTTMQKECFSDCFENWNGHWYKYLRFYSDYSELDSTSMS